MTTATERDRPHTARERILDAAARLFAEVGTVGTTIEDIAREADMSRATVYRHVPGGRDELVTAVLAAEVEQRLTRLVASADASGSMVDRLVAMLSLMFRSVGSDPWLDRLFSPIEIGTHAEIEGFSEISIDIVQRIIADDLGKARRSGELRTDLSDRDVAEWLTRQSLALRLLDTITVRDRTRLEWYLRTLVVAPLLDAT